MDGYFYKNFYSMEKLKEKEKETRLIMNIDPLLKKKLKWLALTNDTTMTILITKALKEVYKKELA